MIEAVREVLDTLVQLESTNDEKEQQAILAYLDTFGIASP